MDWPYPEDDDAAIADPNAPSWECPESLCDCHPTLDTGEKHEVNIMLYAHDGERMKGALCRVRHHGRVLNEDQPNADGSGWVTVVVPHAPTTLLVEWAPASAPRAPDLPHRAWFYVDCEKELEETARRKLHNLGYSARPRLKDNIEVFQRDYGYKPVNGKAKDIATDLDTYHDEGRLPLTPLRGDSGASGGEALAFNDQDGPVGNPPGGGAPGSNAKPQPAPGAPPTKGNPVIAKGGVKPAMDFPRAVDILAVNEAYYEFVRIHLTKGSLEAFFWIFGEALMWQVPDNAKWKDWEPGYSWLPETPRIGVIENRMKLCRLPVLAKDSQDAADMILIRQDELLKIKSDGSDALDSLKASTTGAEPSLLPTPMIYDAAFLGSDVRIQFEQVRGLELPKPPPIKQMSLTYNKGVNKKIQERMDAKPPQGPTGQPRSPKSVGTPGKIWAVHEDMERWQWDAEIDDWYECVINYGFHFFQEGNKQPKVGQPPGSAHNRGHTDYSQILVCVAGHCAVKGGPSEPSAFIWKRTADIYQDATYAPLVNITGKPLKRVRYEGTPADTYPGKKVKGPRWVPKKLP